MRFFLASRNWFAAAAALVAIAFAPSYSTAQVDDSPSVRFHMQFPVTEAPPGPWDVYVSMTKASPGGWGITHVHPGPEMGFTLSGPSGRWENGKINSLPPGARVSTKANVVHAGGNVGTTDAYSMTVHLIPKGAAMSIPREDPGAPAVNGTFTRPFLSKFVVTNPPATPFTLVEFRADAPSGSTIGPHKHGGMVLISLVEGQLTVTQNGVAKVYNAGDSWIEPADEITSVRSTGSTKAIIYAAALLPKDAPLIVPAPK